MPSNGNVKLFRWEVSGQTMQTRSVNSKYLISDLFLMSSCPSIAFEFSVLYGSDTAYCQNEIFVTLRQFENSNPLEVDIKLWIETVGDQRLIEISGKNSYFSIKLLKILVEKHVFKKVGDTFNCKDFSSDDNAKFAELYNNNLKDFVIWCEITEHVVLATNSDQAFLQNQWALYNEGLHDAIIKVGDKAFKVIFN